MMLTCEIYGERKPKVLKSDISEACPKGNVKNVLVR